MDAPGTETFLVAEQATERLEAIVDDLMERQWREVPEFFVTDDPDYRDAVWRSTYDNTELMIGAVRRPSAIPSVLPPGALLEARTAAQHGATPEALLRTYRLGQHALLEHLAEPLDRELLPAGTRPAAVLRQSARALYWYMETVMPLVAREYQDERARLEVRPGLARLRLVQAALAGDASVELGYPLVGSHVAVIAADPDCEAAVAATAGELDAAWICTGAPGDRHWAWIATATGHEVAERLRAAGLRGPAGVGGPCAGPTGLRRAHDQAQLALQAARRRGPAGAVLDVRAVTLEALALGDQRAAFDLARAELGPLAAGDRHARLRETLGVWFAQRESVAATASALGVAPRTVSYRLRRTEAVLGHTIAERRAELEAALRLHRLFATEPPPAG